MDIFEDNFSDVEKTEPFEENKTEEKNNESAKEERKPDPGTRIIYQAPENGAKREYTGFSAEEFKTTEQKKTEYRGGFEFEKDILAKKAEEEKRETEKKAEEKRLKEQMLREKRLKQLLGDSELEDVELDEDFYDDMDIEEIYVGAKKKPSGTGEKVRRTVLAISCVAILISLAVLGYQYFQYRHNSDITDSFSDLIITEPLPNEAPTTPEDTTEKVLTVEEQWAQLKAENPDLVFPAGIQLRYAKLYAANRDFVGYLTVDKLGISLPVVQSNDNNYYMRRNFYKESSKYGCLFVPAASDMKNMSRNTVIYGHNMSDGSMFAALKEYKTIDGFKKAPVIQFDTIYGSYKWKVIAAFITNADEKHDNGYVFPYNFTKLDSSDDFSDFINALRQRSLYDTGVDVATSDKILTLSTCTYDFDDARFVVVARMIRPGESETVDVSKATVNNNPRYPQAYYDKKKKKNPYENAENWYYYAE